MNRTHIAFLSGLTSAALCVAAPIVLAQGRVPSGTPSVVGTIHDSGGKPLAGAAVSAQATDQMFSTSVYTDQDGRYVLPHLTAGRYRLWAQDIGYVTARSELTVAGSHAVQARSGAEAAPELRRGAHRLRLVQFPAGDDPRSAAPQAGNVRHLHGLSWPRCRAAEPLLGGGVEQDHPPHVRHLLQRLPRRSEDAQAIAVGRAADPLLPAGARQVPGRGARPGLPGDRAEADAAADRRGRARGVYRVLFAEPGAAQ